MLPKSGSLPISIATTLVETANHRGGAAFINPGRLRAGYYRVYMSWSSPLLRRLGGKVPYGPQVTGRPLSGYRVAVPCRPALGPAGSPYGPAGCLGGGEFSPRKRAPISPRVCAFQACSMLACFVHASQFMHMLTMRARLQSMTCVRCACRCDARCGQGCDWRTRLPEGVR